MLNDAAGFARVCLVTGYTDLRRGLDGLASIVQSSYQCDPFEPHVLILFCGRRVDRIKGLIGEGDGHLLLYKRLEKGVFQWPRNEAEVQELTAQQFSWLIEGLSIEQKKVIPQVKPQRIM